MDKCNNFTKLSN